MMIAKLQLLFESRNPYFDRVKEERSMIMAQHYVYQFYAELEDFEPKIWRRFEIVGSKTIAELGYTLMVLFEMTASHLFCFTENRQKALLEYLRESYSEEELAQFLENSDVTKLGFNAKYEIDFGGERWTAPNEKLYDADEMTLNHVTKRSGWEITFNYDYGDDWNVNLVLEKCEKKEVSLTTLPNVIEGAGFGIVEDVGGTGGLEEFAEIMKKGKGEAFQEMSEWYGISDFDINHFDREDLNFRMKKLVRVYKDIYEYRYEPTQKSIDIIERKYLK